jgi:lysophospholipid acyltransferase (LPLAT)-like uncharacterized protein
VTFFRKIRETLAVALLHWAYRVLSGTFRYAHLRRPPGGPFVYAHWHGDELLLLGAVCDQGMAVMASRSRDGELMKRLLERLGYYVVRGSSSRGGAGGLKGLIDALSVGSREASLAVDGPRGPIYELKPGVLKLAQETGRPIVLGAASASHRFVFKNAWNRCYLPFPFAKCVIVYGDPVTIPRELSPEAFESIRQQLEASLRKLKAEAEATFSRAADSKLLLMTGCSAGG